MAPADHVVGLQQLDLVGGQRRRRSASGAARSPTDADQAGRRRRAGAAAAGARPVSASISSISSRKVNTPGPPSSKVLPAQAGSMTRPGDRLGHVADEHRLEAGLAAADQRQDRAIRPPWRRTVEEVVLRRRTRWRAARSRRRDRSRGRPPRPSALVRAYFDGEFASAPRADICTIRGTPSSRATSATFCAPITWTDWNFWRPVS